MCIRKEVNKLTLGDGKRQALMLMDEYSSGGVRSEDKDIDLRMVDFFNNAQRNVAAYQRIVREFTPPKQEGASGLVECPMPEDFNGRFRVWRSGKTTRKYRWKQRAILIPAEELGTVTVEYFARPAVIPQDAPDSYPFEVSEEGAACMPFFVAAQQLMVDLVVDYKPLLEIYDRMLSALDTRLPEAGGGGVRQTLYR